MNLYFNVDYLSFYVGTSGYIPLKWGHGTPFENEANRIGFLKKMIDGTIL